MKTNQEPFEALILMGRVAGCFPRRETRLTWRNMVQGLLMAKGWANCWSLAEAIGHADPHNPLPQGRAFGDECFCTPPAEAT